MVFPSTQFRPKPVKLSCSQIQLRLPPTPTSIPPPSAAMGAAEGQQRFRKRGGAKKKKKASSSSATPPADFPASAPRVDFTPSGYVSGFQSTPSTLDSDISSYLSQLQTTLHSLDPDGSLAAAFSTSPSLDVDDPPPSVLLARNALHELAPRIAELSRDGFASHLLESLIRACADASALSATLTSALAAGPGRFASLAAHHAASHVLDAALLALALMTEAEDAKHALDLLADTVGKWDPHHVVEVVTSASGSHVFRTIVSTLAGVPREEPREAKLDDSERGRIRSYIDRMATDVPEEWRKAVRNVAEGLLDTDTINLHDMTWTPAPCTALQALLASVSVSDKELAKRFADTCLNGEEESLMRNACGSRFVERAVLCLGASVMKGAYKGRLRELAQDPKANFVVQRILLGLRGRGEIMSAWDELEEAVPGMLGFGKTREGVVLSLLRATEAEGDENCRRRASRCIARACGTVGEKAKSFVGVLMLGSPEMWTRWQRVVADMGRTGLGVKGRPGDVLHVPRSLPNPSLLGILIARCIMRFPGGPGQTVRDSMATLSGEEVLALIGHPVGSRLVEQWIDGETAAATRKMAGKVMQAVAGEEDAYGVLAVVRNPYGAQVVIRCAAVVAAPMRKTIMEALASDFEQLKTHDCGQMVVRKCRVEHYMRRGNEWEHQETARETRERLFADILDDDGEEEDHEANTKKRKKDKKKRRRDAEGEDSGKRKRTEDPGDVVKDLTQEKSAVIFNSLFASSNKEHAEVPTSSGNTASREEDENQISLEKVLGTIKETAGSSTKKKKSKKKKKKKHKDSE